MEPVEHRLSLLFGYAGAGVVDPQFDVVATGGHGNDDAAALAGEFARVVDQHTCQPVEQVR